MRKRVLLWTIIVVLAGGTAAVTAWLNLRTDYVRSVANHEITPRQIAEAERKIAIATLEAGNIWFVTQEVGRTRLRQFRSRENVWEGTKQIGSCLVADQNQLFVGQYSNFTGGKKVDLLGVNILNLKRGTWRSLKAADGLPGGAVSAIALDGQSLWVGGLGYIALVDPEQDKVLKFARLQAQGVDKIQIGGGYLWAQYDWHLHRAPLSEVR